MQITKGGSNVDLLRVQGKKIPTGSGMMLKVNDGVKIAEDVVKSVNKNILVLNISFIDIVMHQLKYVCQCSNFFHLFHGWCPPFEESILCSFRTVVV
ncbi:hypothetical protein WN944_001146 [Citrus x changshan-huyou]|uniref:Uncharacterized protein n=1 Tax=Citrus x changshan-huyou TaxID=2935761 RepID=A0AAP0MJ77_9ROSI